MSFRVIEPYAIGDAQILSSSVASLDPSRLWAAQQAWAKDELCHRAETRRVYKRVTAGTDSSGAPPPESAPEVWQDVRACNKFAAFVYTESTATTQKDGQPLRIKLRVGKRVDTLGLYGVVGRRATVTVRQAGAVVHGPRVENLLRREVHGWYDWFTAPFLQRGAVAFVSLPPLSGSEIEIEISPASGTASVGYVVVGRAEYLGDLHWRPNITGSNFSRIEREFDGSLRPGVSLIQRRTVPGYSGAFQVPANNVDRVRRVRDHLNAIPALWVGLATQPNSPYYESVLLFGVYRRLEYTPDNVHNAEATIDIEEL